MECFQIKGREEITFAFVEGATGYWKIVAGFAGFDSNNFLQLGSSLPMFYTVISAMLAFSMCFCY